ncbi:hypothetical protein J7M28_01670 [bacterium]|nr:hypothetical protein [bacterium]
MEEKSSCQHCGASVDPAEANDGQCPACGQPLNNESLTEADTKETADGESPKRAPRGLSIGPFLISLGIMLIALAAVCIQCGFKDYIGVMAIALVGGLSLVVIGIIYSSICSWLTLRRRGARALLALSAMVLLFSTAALIAMMGLAPPLAKYASMQCRPSFTAEARLQSQQTNEAYAVAETIAGGMYRLREDIADIAIFAPEGDDKGRRVDYLFGNMGKMPQFSENAGKSWGTLSENLHFVLATNGRTAPRFRYKIKGGWDGSYLRQDVGEDPWGYAYLVSINGLDGGTQPGNNVWCLSAGQNHIVDTPADAEELKGDDIGRCLNALPYSVHTIYLSIRRLHAEREVESRILGKRAKRKH